MTRFTRTYTAQPEHIDELGHVNNAVWLTWIQDIAVAHWRQVAPADIVDASVWVVVRHEIDYRGNISEGERSVAETFVPDRPKGAKFDRRVDFYAVDADRATARPLVSARSTWVMLDAQTRRLMRIPPDLSELFVEKP